MSRSLGQVTAALAHRLGAAPGDLSGLLHDEHERWALYRRALEHPACLPDLFDAVAVEPDPSVALGIVLQVLGGLPPDERAAWTDRLGTERGRAYAARRARELGILQGASVTALLQDASVPESWSDWLQLRLAESSQEPAVLNRLVAAGRTKRIRRLASERERAIRRHSPRAEGA
ncbi:hypothetical protein [Actinacidiphila glaucinigra]|uniref:Uncharacterized protein n=1 Tax=Actinacidiphila glaucinigra TaxID=235986 RepID=A0A239CHY9_9ACTN|nr:hypothetical protein [Actinacidiphila glaucinigra]SNS19750.1 hypothetical protein SAMN05216252_10443 [Actinacidiphila glaucinigra]